MKTVSASPRSGFRSQDRIMGMLGAWTVFVVNEAYAITSGLGYLSVKDASDPISDPIDSLREQVVLWAIQDLKIKRAHLSRDLKIDDPIGWLNDIVNKVCGYNPNMQIVEFIEQSQALVSVSRDNTKKIVLSPLSPKMIRQTNHIKHNQLMKYTDKNLGAALLQRAEAFEVTTLNGGLMFDLELSFVWKNITNQNIQRTESLWIYLTKEY